MNSKIIEVFKRSIKAVTGDKLIDNFVKIDKQQLLIKNRIIRNVSNYRFLIIGFGKAVLSMGLALESKLGYENVLHGLLIVPIGSRKCITVPKNTKMSIFEAAENNIPDLMSLYATKKLIELVSSTKSEEKIICIVLVSGGGSALLAAPQPSIDFEEKCTLIKQLSLRGASITQLNTIRKRLSAVKGGHLGRVLYPLPTIALIISDIVNNPLEYIASGPLCPNLDRQSAVDEVVKKFLLDFPVSAQARKLLKEENKSNNDCSEFRHIDHFILGCNDFALREGAKFALDCFQFQTIIISTSIDGDIVDIALKYVKLAIDLSDFILDKNSSAVFENFTMKKLEFDKNRPICIMAGGEPTLTVKGDGKGGRNQELSLLFAIELNKILQEKKRNLNGIDVWFSSCGSDGYDGPTDAAGAIVSKNTIFDFNDSFPHLSAETFLQKNDSYNFFRIFKNGENMIKLGHTNTNVMDFHLLYLQKSQI